MKKIAAVFLVTLFLISGCRLFKKEPQKAVTEGFIKLGSITKASSLLQINGTVQDTSAAKPFKVQFSVDSQGKVDASDAASPKADMDFKLTATVDDQMGSGEAMVKVADKKVYLKLISLKLPGDSGSALNTQLTQVLNTWWSLPSGNQQNQNPVIKFFDQQRQFADEFKNEKLFVNAVEDGTENIQGVATTRYRVDVDKEAFKKFIVNVARASGTQLGPEDETAIGASLKDIEFSGAVWVSDNDETVHKIHGTITSRPQTGPTSSFDFDYVAWDYGKDVAIAAPESPREFNILMLMPLLGDLSALPGSASVGSATPPLAIPETATPPAKKTPKDKATSKSK